MSSSSTSAPERDQHMLSIGKQCTDPTCLLVDFLPFKCQHCTQSYCADHFRPTDHNCMKYDESKYNRVAPSCPLCNVPVAIPPGEDPNVRMDRHFDTECSVMTGKPRNAKSAPTCARGRCGKVLFAPIRCDKCKQQFCPEHRFPADHSCGSVASSSATRRSAPKYTGAASAAGANAMAAFKRAATPVKPSPASSSSKPAPARAAPAPSGGARPNTALPSVFSKTDRSPTVSPSASHTNSATSPTTPANPSSDADTSSDRCPPKPSSTPHFDFSSFAPPPLFASA